MSDLRYPMAALRGDYLRAGFGLALTIGPALAVPPAAAADYVLIPAAVLFLVFGLRTWQRQRARVVIDSQGISIFKPRRVSLDWRHVRSVRLSYFSTRGDRREGWMQLTLKGKDPQRSTAVRTIRIDSALDDFERVARCAAAATRANRLTISPATRANFDALGIDVSDEPAPKPARNAETTAILGENG